MPTIPNAKKYTIDGCKRVYRDGKLLKTRVSENGVFARVYHDDGQVHSVNVASLCRPKLTPEHIFKRENAKTHPEYSDYAVTAYGDLYCVRPPKAGRHANECYIVPDFHHGPRQKRHVSIRRPNGTRYIVRLAKLVKETWGGASQFNDD
jgi:hypothetical protein